MSCRPGCHPGVVAGRGLRGKGGGGLLEGKGGGRRAGGAGGGGSERQRRRLQLLRASVGPFLRRVSEASAREEGRRSRLLAHSTASSDRSARAVVGVSYHQRARPLLPPPPLAQEKEVVGAPRERSEASAREGSRRSRLLARSPASPDRSQLLASVVGALARCPRPFCSHKRRRLFAPRASVGCRRGRCGQDPHLSPSPSSPARCSCRSPRSAAAWPCPPPRAARISLAAEARRRR
jgi:hypothetical protein